MKETEPTCVTTSSGEKTYIRDTSQLENPLIKINTLQRECPENIVVIDTDYPHALPAHQENDTWLKIQNIQYIIRGENGCFKTDTAALEAPIDSRKTE